MGLRARVTVLVVAVSALVQLGLGLAQLHAESAALREDAALSSHMERKMLLGIRDRAERTIEVPPAP